MPHIHNVNRKPKGNRYCGPAVISALTKLDTDQAAALIRHRHNLRSIKGTSRAHVWDILRLCGYLPKSVAEIARAKRPTLAGWLRSTRSERKTGRVYLVVAGNHWQLIEGRRYVCGIVGTVVTVAHDKVKRRARVSSVYEVGGEYRHPVDALEKIATKVADRKAVLNKDAAHKRVVAQARREELVEWDFWDDKAYPPSVIYPGRWWRDAEAAGIADPYEGDHDGGDWAGAAELVETYRKIKESLSK